MHMLYEKYDFYTTRITIKTVMSARNITKISTVYKSLPVRGEEEEEEKER